MMPRFITEVETAYDKAFPDSDATCFFSESEDNRWEKKLQEAIDRGSPLTQEEVVWLCGSQQAVEDHIDYLRQWGITCKSS